MKLFTSFMIFLGAPALACGPIDDTSGPQDELIASIQAAPNQVASKVPSGELWELWLKAPDTTAQDLLDNGLERLRIFDFEGAIKGFDALIAYCPDYAEGYNQRAYAYFLREDYASALPDLDAAIERSPKHIGAISGRALTLLALGRELEGQKALREALALNPWLSERGLLREMPGEDL